MMHKLSYDQTEKLLQRFRIPHVSQGLAKTEKEAIQKAKKFGFPVVMKVSSPQIIHKTESGGIILNVQNEGEVSAAYKKISKNVKASQGKATIEGIIVQKQIQGKEVIIGSKIDPSFGPVIMFGLGGIFVEVLQDVAFRLVPIEKKDAEEMIREIKGYPVLAGIRGEKPVNIKKIEELLLAISSLVQKNPSIKELDINPVLVNEKEALPVDVRIIV